MNWSRHPRIQLIANLLHHGAVVAYPTEAVWGLGCDPQNAEAVAALLALKSRPQSKGVILVAAHADQLQAYVGHLTAEGWQTLRTPPSDRPVTWVVPAGAAAPVWITGGRPTIAVRVSSHPVVAGLCQAFGGPLVSTSANPGGRAPAKTAFKVHQYFGRQLDAIAPGNVGGAAKPSEIKDIHTGEILRPGDSSQ